VTNPADDSNRSVEQDAQSKDTSHTNKWKLLALWAFILTLVNIFLSLAVIAAGLEFKSVSLLVGFVVGNTLGIPCIILVLSQLWPRFRHARARVKAVLYPTYLVFVSLLVSFVTLAGDIADKTS